MIRLLSLLTNRLAVVRESGAMEQRPLKNGRNPKILRSRKLIRILTLAFLVLIQAVSFNSCMLYKAVQDEKQGVEMLKDFESRMASAGYTRRVVVYDFFSESDKATYSKYWYTIGMWINPKDKLIALRLERNSWNEVVIPFDKLKKVEIIEDGGVVSSGHIGYFGGTSSTSKEISKGLQVRVSTVGDIEAGAKSYTIKLFDPQGVQVTKSSPFYKAIQECARSINDDIENILNAGK